MSQCCGKVPTNQEVGYLTNIVLETVRRYGNAWQGELGEAAATEYAVNELHLHVENFDKKVHGFDNVCRNSSGKLVIIESKATKASGLSSLSPTNFGKEGSVQWVEYKARLMCDPTSSFHTEANAKIGEEILRVGARNVEFLVIHTNPVTAKIDVTKLR